MATNSQPMAWPGRRTASTSPTTAKPGTTTRCGDRALKPRSRFSTSSTTARTSSSADRAVKAQAKRVAAGALTRLDPSGPSTWRLAADRLPPWFVLMSLLCVGVCPMPAQRGLAELRLQHPPVPFRERYGHRDQ